VNCPKCDKEMVLLGTDMRGDWYACTECQIEISYCSYLTEEARRELREIREESLEP